MDGLELVVGCSLVESHKEGASKSPFSSAVSPASATSLFSTLAPCSSLQVLHQCDLSEMSPVFLLLAGSKAQSAIARSGEGAVVCERLLRHWGRRNSCSFGDHEGKPRRFALLLRAQYSPQQCGERSRDETELEMVSATATPESPLPSFKRRKLPPNNESSQPILPPLWSSWHQQVLAMAVFNSHELQNMFCLCKERGKMIL